MFSYHLLNLCVTFCEYRVVKCLILDGFLAVVKQLLFTCVTQCRFSYFKCKKMQISLNQKYDLLTINKTEIILKLKILKICIHSK